MIWCCCKKDSVLWYFGHCLKIWRAAECSFVSDVAVSGKFVYKSHNRTLSNCSSYSSSNLLKLNTTTMYIISKFDCLILYITSCEWFISISEILPQEDSDSEKKSSMSYHIDEDFKSKALQHSKLFRVSRQLLQCLIPQLKQMSNYRMSR